MKFSEVFTSKDSIKLDKETLLILRWIALLGQLFTIILVRFIFNFQLEFFLNDDVDGPTALIGTKMVPILAKDDGTYMAESLDIVTFIDQNFGEPVLAPSANRPELTDWLANAALNPLTMPRWVQAPLAEFATAGGVGYFTEKKEESIGPFAEHLANSAELKEELNIKLVTLAAIIESPGAVNGTLSYEL